MNTAEIQSCPVLLHRRLIRLFQSFCLPTLMTKTSVCRLKSVHGDRSIPQCPRGSPSTQTKKHGLKVSATGMRRQ